MPIRVKPVHNLGPCVLDMDSIKGICAVVDKTFHYALYSATDGAWEIYDEESAPFLTAIADRTKLDSFSAAAPSGSVYSKALEIQSLASNLKLPVYDNDKSVKLSFNSNDADATFNVPPDQVEWVEHFMYDLKKHIRRPQFGQRRTSYTSVVSGNLVHYPASNTRIILKKKQPNPTVTSIRDNLAANLIYDVAKVLLGVIIALLIVWIYSRYGVNVGNVLTPPGIPTPTLTR